MQQDLESLDPQESEDQGFRIPNSTSTSSIPLHQMVPSSCENLHFFNNFTRNTIKQSVDVAPVIT
ncbi:hypothetical protein LINPERHAP1_LOCUS25935 [Linum perenne]